MMQEVAAGCLNFFEYFIATILFHFDFGAYGNHIFQRRVASTVDGCSVLSIVARVTQGGHALLPKNLLCFQIK